MTSHQDARGSKFTNELMIKKIFRFSVHLVVIN